MYTASAVCVKYAFILFVSAVLVFFAVECRVARFEKCNLACLNGGVATRWGVLGWGQAVQSGGKVVQKHKLTPALAWLECTCTLLHLGKESEVSIWMHSARPLEHWGNTAVFM